MRNLHRMYLYTTITTQTSTFLSSNDNLCEGGRGGEERRCSVETSNDILIEKYVVDVILYNIKLVELKIMIYYCFNVIILLLQCNIQLVYYE